VRGTMHGHGEWVYSRGGRYTGPFENGVAHGDGQVDNVLQGVEVCCSVLQCVAVCCSVLQCVAVLPM